MLKTNLKYFDYRTLKLYNVYMNDSGNYYIRRGNKYRFIYKEETFDPEKSSKFNHANLVRYLHKQIKIYDSKVAERKQNNDDWNMNRAIGNVAALESVLEYVLKMQEDTENDS